jgi:hypothetical protein
MCPGRGYREEGWIRLGDVGDVPRQRVQRGGVDQRCAQAEGTRREDGSEMHPETRPKEGLGTGPNHP